jgi:thiosulfate/3-mercaptopyruvate sulfurtransferase
MTTPAALLPAVCGGCCVGSVTIASPCSTVASIAGWQKGRPLVTDLPKVSPTVLEVDLRDWVVSSEAVLPISTSRPFCLIDARSPGSLSWRERNPRPVGGHIPGARNRFFRDNLDADGCFRPAAELRREFLALLAGGEPEQVVMSCGSGVTACHNLLAMEIAGLHGRGCTPVRGANGAAIRRGRWATCPTTAASAQ